MSSGQQATFPIQQWEGAGEYIAKLLNAAMKKAGDNADQDSRDLDDSELMKSWKDNAHWYSHHDNWYWARVFRENEHCWTGKEPRMGQQLYGIQSSWMPDRIEKQMHELDHCEGKEDSWIMPDY